MIRRLAIFAAWIAAGMLAMFATDFIGLAFGASARTIAFANGWVACWAFGYAYKGATRP